MYESRCFIPPEGASRYKVDLHAYVLMSNHIHVLATAQNTDGIPWMMRYIGRYYVPYIDHTYGTTGSI